MKKIWVILVIIVVWKGSAQDFVYDYIENYKDIAINEMNSYKIPASITLAQGMLESDWGRSELCTTANNHFGIKCGGSWTGKSYMHEDDEYKRGKIVESCFRHYDSSDDSFRDHSLFLLKDRYSFLYEYSVSDYKSWAKGLVKAGYATDKKYADKLILIIEKYGLYEYDTYYVDNSYVNNSSDSDRSDKNKYVNFDDKYNSNTETVKISMVNDCKVLLSKDGDTAYKIAKELGISPSKLMSYNRDIRSKYQKLGAGHVVYLEKKKSKYLGKESYYIALRNESLSDISNKFGIKLRNLAKINNTDSDAIFRKGETILLKKKDKNSYNNGEWVSNDAGSKYLFDEPLVPKER